MTKLCLIAVLSVSNVCFFFRLKRAGYFFVGIIWDATGQKDFHCVRLVLSGRRSGVAIILLAGTGL